MAEDFSGIVDEFEKAIQSGSSLSNVMESVNNKIRHYKELSRRQGAGAEEIEKFTNIAEKLSNYLDGLKLKLIESGDALKALGLDSGLLSEKLGGLKGPLNEIIQSFTGGILPAIKQNVAVLGVWKNDFIRNVVDPSKDFRMFSQGIFKGLNDSLKNLLDTQLVARRAFTMLGDSVGEANRKTSDYPRILRATSASFGLTKEKIQEFNGVVGTVPGMLDTASESLLKSVGVQDRMIQTSGVLQVALNRFGLTGSQAANKVREGFYDLGLNAERFVEFMGEVNAALRETDIDAGTAMDQIMSSSKVMGIFGEQASRTTSIWSEFASTLRSSGVAANQVGNIVNSVTQSLAGMSTQNRAFISMMSGMFTGATALGGALRMELMMRGPGGLERSLEGLTTSLARFGGGRIITLEQAAQNPQLEMQFVLQRQMLGKLAGITNTEQQNRILEVMQGVQRGGISRLEGSKELKEVMNKGRNIQEQTLTAIERQEQILQNTAENILSVRLGNIDQQLETFTRAFGIGRRGATGEVQIERTGISQMGAVFGMRRGGEAIRAVNEAAELMGRNIRQAMFPGELLRGRMQGAQTRGPLETRNIRPGAFTGQILAEGMTRMFQEIFSIGRPEMIGRQIRAARLPRTPGEALIPGEEPRQFPVFEAPIRPTQRMNLEQVTEQVTRNVVERRNIMPIGGIETFRSRGESATREAPVGGEVVRGTESSITIKVEADQTKFRDLTISILEKELPKYLNGEHFPEER